MSKSLCFELSTGVSYVKLPMDPELRRDSSFTENPSGSPRILSRANETVLVLYGTEPDYFGTLACYFLIGGHHRLIFARNSMYVVDTGRRRARTLYGTKSTGLVAFFHFFQVYLRRRFFYFFCIVHSVMHSPNFFLIHLISNNVICLFFTSVCFLDFPIGFFSYHREDNFMEYVFAN